MKLKKRTQGIDPKLPAQAIVTILAFVLTYFGIDLTPEVSAAIAVVLGAAAAYWAPPAKVVLKEESNVVR